MSLRREVVITGQGLVTPIGVGPGAFRAALADGRSGVRRIRAFDPSGLPGDFAGEVADFDAKLFVKPRKSLKVMSRDIQLGFAAADMACQNANLSAAGGNAPAAVHPIDPDRLGVVFGADMIYCELDELAAPFRACIVDGQFDFSRWGTHAIGEMYPLWLLKYLPNMTACHVGIAHDARGPNNTITLGEVSSLVAIGEAVRTIERGQADAMIAGGTSARLHPTLMAFRDPDVWSRRCDDPAAACRPFDADRDGMVGGEGAAAFVLESRDHALARGAIVWATIAGFASTFQSPNNLHARCPPHHAIGRAIDASLADAGLPAHCVALVAASGLATIPHDRIEAQAIRQSLGSVPVTAVSSFMGATGAASGAMQLAEVLAAFDTRRIPITLNYERPDPDCPIDVVHGTQIPLERPVAVIVGHSTTGQAAALVVTRPI